jgi:hypothetical protein
MHTNPASNPEKHSGVSQLPGEPLDTMGAESKCQLAAPFISATLPAGLAQTNRRRTDGGFEACSHAAFRGSCWKKPMSSAGKQFIFSFVFSQQSVTRVTLVSKISSQAESAHARLLFSIGS